MRVFFYKSSMVFALLLLSFCQSASTPAVEMHHKAPEFTEKLANSWINSSPLSIKQLRGKVLLVNIFTYGCWNCYRSFPWIRDLEQRLSGKGLQLIGIHSPEFSHEKVRKNVIAKVKHFRLKFPVMIDNEFRYWGALGNNAWPSFYLVDKQGNLRYKFVGETHKNTSRAKQVERAIEALLKE
ncbi:MAG: redoxin family protein [Spirochaetota bacterium]